MGIYTPAIQKLYVAYFNRPADVGGLGHWESVVAAAKGDTSAVSAFFAASAEYKAAYANMDAYHVVNAVYMNLFGRPAEPTGLNFWAQNLMSGAFTVDQAVTKIADGAQGTDLDVYNNKVIAATAFTAALDTNAEILGYSGDAANLLAKQWMNTITSDAKVLQDAITPANLDQAVSKVTTPVVTPLTFNLTSGVDTVPGGAGNDIINATTSDGKIALTTFDTVDGGAGVDTINFVDTTTTPLTQLGNLPGTVKNVEIANITTTGGVNLGVKSWAGVTDLNVTAAGSAAAAVTVADTTNVNLSTATVVGTASVTGGKAVNVVMSSATASDATVKGAGLTNVSIKGGAIATVDNIDAAAASGKGATLTNVTLDGVLGATASLSGTSLTNVSLKNIVQADAVTVNNTTAAHSLSVSVDGVGYDAAGTAVAVSVADAVATGVTVHANGASNLAVSGAKIAKATVDGSAALALDLTAAGVLTSVDASASTGGVTLTGLNSGVTSITTGAGNDVFTFNTATVKDDTNTTADETVSATVSSGAGNDKIIVAASGTGKVTVDAGAGNDTVTITGRSDTLAISLGDGNDVFKATVAINGTDTIDAGAGTDTLALSLVGSANIGAFSNFDVFDAAGLAKTLDVDILASKNNVTEFIASGDVGVGAALTNVGAGVGVRVTGDMAASSLSITQKTAGALTVTVDADETGKATDTVDTRTAAVSVENATSLKAVFDTSYLASTKVEPTVGDNITTLNLAAKAATSLEIVSGGSLSNNVLSYNDSANKLASITVSGAQGLNLSVTSTKLATVDASASTGGLTFNTSSLADGGKVILGSGVDTITVTAGGTSVESIQGIEKSGSIVVSTDADATAKAAAIKDADTLVFGTADVTVANANAAVTTGTIAKGVLTFTGAGPATLADAILIADAAAETANEAVVFQYLGDSYAFVQGGATDIVVKLVGVTGVAQLAEVTADHFTLI